MRQVSLKTRWVGLGAGVVALTLAATGLWVHNLRAQSPSELHSPMTKTEQVTDNYHGVEVVDPYRWLEDQQSPDTRAWINEQNMITQALLATWPERDQLKRRMGELLKIDSINVPVEENGRLFFSKRRADQDQGILYVRKSRGGADEVLVDPNPMSSDHTISVNFETASDDGTLVAYSLRQGGEDETTIHLLDVDKHTELPDVLPRLSTSPSPSNPTRADCITRAAERCPGSFTTPWAPTPRMTR